MGKNDGKHIRGLVGKTVHRLGKDGMTIVQSAPDVVRQTKDTIKMSNVFGISSTMARYIRSKFGMFKGANYDAGMVPRFNGHVNEILRHSYDKKNDSFHFQEDSFSRLSGFEFNNDSPLSSSLWVDPIANLSGNTLTFSLPEFAVSSGLKFPDKANLCVLTALLARIAPEEGLIDETYHGYSIEISADQSILPAQDFQFEVLEGCLNILGIGLKFYSQHGNIRTERNNKAFNPSALCGAIISPGTFVLPDTGSTTNRSKASPWQSMGIQFPGSLS